MQLGWEMWNKITRFDVVKSELEVRLMNEKIDQLLHQEMRRFMEIQQIQMDMLNEMHSKIR